MIDDAITVNVLRRTVLAETASSIGVYTGGFLLVMITAMSMQLLHKGVPLLGIFDLLPYLIGFMLPYVIPLSVAAGSLSTLGRMREDGELQALAASGISNHTVIANQLPLILLIAVLHGWVNLFLVPETTRNFRVNHSLALRQGIPSFVAQQEPIFKDDGGTLSAISVDDDTLHHLSGFIRDPKTGEQTILYAPQAKWAFADTLFYKQTMLLCSSFSTKEKS